MKVPPGMNKMARRNGLGPTVGGMGNAPRAANPNVYAWVPTPWYMLHRRVFGYRWRKWGYISTPIRAVDRFGWRYQTNRQRAREVIAQQFGPVYYAGVNQAGPNEQKPRFNSPLGAGR